MLPLQLSIDNRHRSFTGAQSPNLSNLTQSLALIESVEKAGLKSIQEDPFACGNIGLSQDPNKVVPPDARPEKTVAALDFQSPELHL